MVVEEDVVAVAAKAVGGNSPCPCSRRSCSHGSQGKLGPKRVVGLDKDSSM